MEAVILLGGEGTRMRPLSYFAPKQLLPIAEVPLIERVVAWLEDAGVDSVVFSLCYKPEAFQDAFPDGQCKGSKVAYALEPEPLDTAGAIGYASSFLQGEEGPLVVINGDVLTDIDLGAIVAFHNDSGAKATVGLVEVEDPSRFGVVDISSEGRILRFVEKPTKEAAPSNLANGGIYVFDPEVVRSIPKGRRVSVEREVFPDLASQGVLFGIAPGGYWIDTGTPASYLQANLDVLMGKLGRPSAPGAQVGAGSPWRNPPAPGARQVSPGIWQMGLAGIVKGELVSECLLGEGVEVGEAARVEACVLGRRASVGRGCDLTQCVVMPGAWIGQGARLSRCIVGPGAKVGEGAKLEGEDVIVLAAGEERS
jgi:mannose-1-phosphate guanylyltransferase